MLYGAAYYPEHRDPAYWEYDLDNMAAIHFNVLRVGEFSWKRFEPQEGMYDFAWMDRFAEMAGKRGIKLLLCPPLRTAPSWLMEQDPTIAIETDKSRRLAYGSRYSFCINHPLLLEKGMKLAREMAKHYANNENIMGWHLDNEYGDEPDCHCPVCEAKWHAWLAEKYKDIDALNQAWGNVFWSLEYDRFDQVGTPKESKCHYNPAHMKAWRQFRSECTVEVVEMHAEAVRAFAKQPITSNNQPGWNPRTDYYKMAEHLDVCGTNYYPPFSENCRAISFGLAACRGYKGKNFHVHELRNGTHAIPGRGGNTPAPGQVERLTAHVVGNGADAIFYFRYKACPFGQEQIHGTLVGYDGKPKRIYHECMDIGEKLSRISDDLEGTEVKSEVAVLYDFPTRWLTEQESSWSYPKNMYVAEGRKLYNTVRDLGYNCDVVGRYQAYDKYKVLIVPMVTCMDDTLVKNLRDYVHQGGTLIWQPLSGQHNADGEIYGRRLHPELMKLFGIDVAEFATKAKDDHFAFSWNGRDYEGQLFADLPELAGAERLAQYKNDWFSGTACLTKQSFGEGDAYYVATFADRKFYEDFLENIFAKSKVERIRGIVIPSEIEAVERSCKGKKLTFLMNTTDIEQTITLNKPMMDVWNDEELQGEVWIKPNGVRVLK